MLLVLIRRRRRRRSRIKSLKSFKMYLFWGVLGTSNGEGVKKEVENGIKKGFV